MSILFFCPHPSRDAARASQRFLRLTSQMAAVLQVVDSLPDIALAQFLANETGHHGADPLFPNDGILGSLEGLGVVVINAVERGGNRRLLALEELGLGRRHVAGSALSLGESRERTEEGWGRRWSRAGAPEASNIS